MTKKKKPAASEDGDVTIGAKIPAQLAARIEAIRIEFQREAPPGITYTKSDAVRALLLAAVTGREQEAWRNGTKARPVNGTGAQEVGA